MCRRDDQSFCRTEAYFLLPDILADLRLKPRLNLLSLFGATLAAQNLALLLMDQEKLDEAESEFAAILDVVKREYGEESFYTMMTASSLADCFQKQEKYQESASMYARARKIGDLILPSDHQMLIVLKAKEGGALLKDGQLGRAERLLVESYPELETRKGLKDPLTIATRNHLYELYSRTNRQKIADRYLQN